MDGSVGIARGFDIENPPARAWIPVEASAKLEEARDETRCIFENPKLLSPSRSLDLLEIVEYFRTHSTRRGREIRKLTRRC